MNLLRLKPGKDRALSRRHPWIFANAVADVEGRPAPGATVTVLAANGRFLARAAYSPSSQIRARVWTFDENEPVDHALIKRRLAQAVEWRRRWTPADARNTAARLVFGEADGMPGLIVDQYGKQLACQFTAAGVEHWKSAIVDGLVKATGCTDIYERSDAAVREREGLALTTGVLAGEEPPEFVEILESGVRYLVDVRKGHKTGFYLDQRDNRALVQAHAVGRDVLNCFCYTGGFSLAALSGGAQSVLSIDSSGEALALAEKHVGLNGFDAARAEWRDADAFRSLRDLRDAGRKFGLVVLDPPKFAPSAQHAESALRAYREINRVGMQLLAPGGLLFTFSCSGAIDAAMFQKMAADSAADAGVDARVIRRLSAGADHPMPIGFNEGEYLKGLMLALAG
ncbi:MAG: class I SAM-dependent rRNA methyltransferase [Candidatus Protistobacter heckmanni]|nr:class I SAM-dependent rRNA methyltransferase [Candidatus Protistobacter heckmanni]